MIPSQYKKTLVQIYTDNKKQSHSIKNSNYGYFLNTRSFDVKKGLSNKMRQIYNKSRNDYRRQGKTTAQGNYRTISFNNDRVATDRIISTSIKSPMLFDNSMSIFIFKSS